MQTLYVPKYGITYRVNQKNPRELLWSVKPFGPATQWQHAYTFSKPIRALDTDDQTGQGVVVLNDSTTYVGSGVRVWGKKFYTAGSRIYSLYAIGEKKVERKLRIKVHEKNRTCHYRTAWKWKNDGMVDGGYCESRRELDGSISWFLEHKDEYIYAYWEPVDKYYDSLGPAVFIIGDESMV